MNREGAGTSNPQQVQITGERVNSCLLPRLLMVFSSEGLFEKQAEGGLNT